MITKHPQNLTPRDIKSRQRAVDALKAPDPSGKPVIYWQAHRPGFGVLVSGKTQAKSYIAQRDLAGKTRRITIAPTNSMSFADADKEAAKLLLDMQNGIDPKAERKAKLAAEQAKVVAEQAEAERSITLGKIADEFFAARPQLREKSRKDYDGHLKGRKTPAALEPWLDKPLREITRGMVEARHRAIAAEVNARNPKRSGASSANGAMRTLRALWNFAADKYDFGPAKNPVRLKKQWFPEPRRETYVHDEELPKFYAAVQALTNDVARDYLILLLFTGLRKSEAASLTWDDIDLQKKILRIPGTRTKAKRPLGLPLSDVVFEMLEARRALGRTAYVFPSRSASGHIEEPRFPLRQIAEASGVDISAHDLRRTFATVAESCRLTVYELKGLLNHSLGGDGDVTKDYVIKSAEDLREPMQQVTDKLKRLCGIGGDNVVRLKASAGWPHVSP